MRCILVALLVVALLGSVSADAGAITANALLVVSDEAMFNATLALNPSVLVFYVHSLCTACPKVLEVAEQLARRRIGSVAVMTLACDGPSTSAICAKQLHHFTPPVVVHYTHGARIFWESAHLRFPTVEEFETFLSLETIQPLASQQALEAFKAEMVRRRNIAVIAFDNDANSEVVRNVSEASRRAAARSGYGFAYAIGLANQTAGRVLVYNPGRPEPEEFAGSLTFTAFEHRLVDWLWSNGHHPYARQVDRLLRDRMSLLANRTVFFLLVNGSDTSSLLDDYTTLALENPTHFFTWINATVWGKRELNPYRVSSAPAMARVETVGDDQYVTGHVLETPNLAAMRDWMQGLANGTIVWKGRSLPVPQQDPNANYITVVRDTWKELVIDSSSHVLVNLNATLTGQSDLFGAVCIMAKLVPNLQVAYFDLANNELKVAESFLPKQLNVPVFVLYRAQRKMHPLIFSPSPQGIDPDALIAWVRENLGVAKSDDADGFDPIEL